MKRIKLEEIQQTLKNYIKKRNISTGATSQTGISLQANAVDHNQSVAANLVLAQASISSFYTFSLDSASTEVDFWKEFEA